MSTYNFAKSKKNNLDHTHTNMRLKDQHVDAPETITEKQFGKKYHTGEPEVTIESQLEKVRTGGADKIIEKNLNDSKSKFGSKHRNAEAYEGDINKLEEKRLSDKKVEDEKYSASSETPKKVRWWDGLKKSQSNKTVKTAAFGDEDFEEGHEFDPDVSFNRLKKMLDPEEEGVIPDEDFSGNLDDQIDVIEEEDTEKELEKEIPRKMFITRNKEGQTPMPHINMELAFDPDSFNNEEEIREAALEKVLEIRPNLEGKIDVSNFSQVLSGSIDSKIRLLLVGDEYFTDDGGMDSDESSIFTNIESEDVDAGGTPMTVGKVTLSPHAEAMEREDLLKGLVDFITDKTGINVSENAIQINFSKNEATFAFDPEGMAVSTNTEENALLDEENEEDDIFNYEEDEEDEEDEDIIPEEPQPEFPVEDITGDNLKPQAKSVYDFPIVVADSKKK